MCSFSKSEKLKLHGTAPGLALLAAALLAASAAAHGAGLVRSEPPAGVVLDAPPGQVLVWFSEELETEGSTLQVFAAGGRQVDLGDGGVDLNDPDHASLKAGLSAIPAGTYTVCWLTVLYDGDVTAGQFTFAVSERGRAEPAACPGAAPAGAEAGRSISRVAWVASAVIAAVALAGIWIVRRR